MAKLTTLTLETIKTALQATKNCLRREHNGTLAEQHEAALQYVNIALDGLSLIDLPAESSDITIEWGNRRNYNRHKIALDIQDASNLRALAREFVKVVDDASDATRSTTATWEDPAVVLFVNKFESLCHSNERFSEAYAACKEKQ